MKAIHPLCILILILMSACSTTKSYPPNFYGYTPQEQSLIRNSQIAVGFDEEKVRMSWGNPDSIHSTLDSFYWTYNSLKTKNSVFQQVGTAIVRGNDPAVAATNNSFHNRVTKRVVFDKETKRVISFQTY